MFVGVHTCDRATTDVRGSPLSRVSRACTWLLNVAHAPVVALMSTPRVTGEEAGRFTPRTLATTRPKEAEPPQIVEAERLSARRMRKKGPISSQRLLPPPPRAAPAQPPYTRVF